MGLPLHVKVVFHNVWGLLKDGGRGLALLQVLDVVDVWRAWVDLKGVFAMAAGALM